MGRRMATNLARSGVDGGFAPLIVWNRSEDGVEEFKTWAKQHEVEEAAYEVSPDLAYVVKQ